MDFAKNFKNIMKEKNIKPNSLAKKMGLSRSTISHWSNGIRFPKDDKTISLLAKHLGVIEQELFDKNAKKRLVEYELKNNLNDYKKHIKSDTNMIQISYLEDVYASAGDGAVNDSYNISHINFCKEFLQNLLGFYDFSKVHIIKAFGNSMEPTILEGEFLFISPAPKGYNLLKDRSIYVFNFKGDIYVKRLIKSQNKEYIYLSSDNKKVEDIKIEKDNFDKLKVLGKVLGHFNIKTC